MPYGIPRVACCASLNLWETHGVCGLPLSAYLTSKLFMHTLTYLSANPLPHHSEYALEQFQVTSKQVQSR